MKSLNKEGDLVKKQNMNKKIVLVTAVVLAFLLGAFSVYAFLRFTKNVLNIDDNKEIISLREGGEVLEPDFSDGLSTMSSGFDYGKIEVDWYIGARFLSFEEKDFFIKNTPENLLDDPNYPYGFSEIVKLGKVVYPKNLVGEEITLVIYMDGGLGCSTNYLYFVFDKEKNKFSLLSQDNFPELLLPDRIDLPEFGSRLEVRILDSLQCNSILRGGITSLYEKTIFDYTKIGEKIYKHSMYGDIYYKDRQFRVIAPDGGVYIYELIPYFFEDKQNGDPWVKSFYPEAYEASIVWRNNARHTSEEKYTLSGDLVSSCSGHTEPCTNVVTTTEWFVEENLVEIGRTAVGNEPVYELKDKEVNPYYKNFSELFYAPVRKFANEKIEFLDEENQPEILSDYNDDFVKINYSDNYKKFLEDEPLFFWRDHFGNWRVYKKSSYTMLGECGKPVIYLYPKTEMDVNVRISPNAGLTVVDPEYPDGGWFVRAKPDGSLTDLSTGKNYPYLFWEGLAYGYTSPREGFVLSKKEIPSSMRRILKLYGLNVKESEDFMEFWEEKLIEDDYVLIKFLPQEEFEKVAPLEVTPKPDTTIRVFMQYQPLSAPVAVRPPTITTPERNGFTVVEWGGELRGD